MTLANMTVLAHAAAARRREMPVAIALVLLTGGIAAAVLGGAGPVAWAAVMVVLFILDTELYRRLDTVDAQLTQTASLGIAVWAFFCSTFYVALPIALWAQGQAAGAVAAMVLWVVGVVRQFDPGLSGSLAVAIAGAAPPALSLMGAPLWFAAHSPQPDWDLAVIAVAGGGALTAYVMHARLRAQLGPRAAREEVQHRQPRAKAA